MVRNSHEEFNIHSISRASAQNTLNPRQRLRKVDEEDLDFDEVDKLYHATPYGQTLDRPEFQNNPTSSRAQAIIAAVKNSNDLAP